MTYPSRRGAGAPGADGKQVELQEGSGYVQWRYAGETTWRNLMPLADISGADGRSVNLRVNAGWIQWQHDGDSSWKNLMSMDDMRGDDGKDGANNTLSIGTVSSGPAAATITGNSPNQTLNLVLPPGIPGTNGTNGTNGVNGVGVASQTITYQQSASGTIAPTGTWTTAIPAVTKGTYLWTRIVLTLTDGSSSTSYAVAYQAVDGTNGTNGANYTPQTMVSRTVTVATPYQHTDLTKPFKVMLNARSTQTVTVAGLVNDRVELRVGPNAAAVAPGGTGGFSVGVWESGITGIALMVGAAVQDGGQVTADVPAGWYFQINRLSGTSATIVSCFTQSMS